MCLHHHFRLTSHPFSFSSRGVKRYSVISAIFCFNVLIQLLLQALALPSSYHKGKIMALRLLCTVVVRPHDIALPRNQLLLFFRAIHHSLVGQDQVYPSIINSLCYFISLLICGVNTVFFSQDAINTVIKYCGARFFSLQLPGYSLLMLDFLHAANTIISNNDLKGVNFQTF